MNHRLFVAALSALALPTAQGATQGSFGTSSTGNFTLTAEGPATPRQVQVLNLSDKTLNNGSRADTNVGTPGVSMSFCLVENYGGAVQLELSTANGVGGPDGWSLMNGGTRIFYGVTVTTANTNSNLGTLPSLAGSFVATVPAGIAVTTTTSCGTGNIKFNAVLTNPTLLPETIPARSYTDTITVVATPQ